MDETSDPLFGRPQCLIFNEELCVTDCEYGIAGDCPRRTPDAMRSVSVKNPPDLPQMTERSSTEAVEPQKSAAERIADALEEIAFNLGDEGPIAEQLYLIRERLEEVTPEGQDGRHFLRTIDIGRD